MTAADVKRKHYFLCLHRKWWIRGTIIFLIAAAAFLISFFLIPTAATPGLPPPSDGQQAAFIIFMASEALVLGFGISFLITHVKSVHKAPPKTKKKVVITFICICYILIQWWPHSQLRKSKVKNFSFSNASKDRYFGFNFFILLLLEITFHIVNNVAMAILAYYQFELLLLCMA